MRRSTAQSISVQGGEQAQGAGRGLFGWKLGAGYRMKPTDERGRAPMTTRRASGERLEIRLGALQVFVWLGLALGSIFAAYGLGFVSGKSVGFESARSSSGIEVAKLAVSDALPPERSEQSVSGIYDRLNAPAVLDRGTEPGKADAKGSASAPTKPVRDITAERVKQIQDEDAAANARSSGDDSASSLAEIESIFADESAGSAEVESAKNVKILGSDKAKAAAAAAQPASDADKKTVGSLLDERLGENQAAASAGGLEEQASGKVMGAVTTKTEPATAPVALQPEKKTAPAVEAPATKIAVTKKLKKGYYAQVQAPKTVEEAEQTARKLRDSGFPVVIESANSGGQSFYRVLVGPEDKKVQAERFLGQLKSEKYLKGTPFIKPVS